MPKEILDEKYGHRARKAVVVFFLLVMFFGLPASLALFRDNGSNLIAGTVIGLLIVVMIGVGAWMFDEQNHYKCPQCHAHVPMLPTDNETKRHRFLCKDCDVLWLTNNFDGERD